MEKVGHGIEVGDGREMGVKGIIALKFKIGDEAFEAKFHVTPKGNYVVLGTSFIEDYTLRITVGRKSSCSIGVQPVELIEVGGRPRKVMTMNTVTVAPGFVHYLPMESKNPKNTEYHALYEASSLLYVRAPWAYYFGCVG